MDASDEGSQLVTNNAVESPSEHVAGSKFLALSLFAVAFFFAYKYAAIFTFNFPAPLWFPDSVLLCALLVVPRGQWWCICLSRFQFALRWKCIHLHRCGSC
jgi:hypothetical protein